LKNLNDIETNATAIDLYDNKNGISIQVTSESEISKYRKTVEKFVAAGLHHKYQKLIVLVITRRKRTHKKDVINQDGFSFDIKEDVWDIDGKILNELRKKSLDELSNILSFIERNLKFKEDGEIMNTTQNFNFHGSHQIINVGSGTQNITQNNEVNEINQAKKLFDNDMFYEAKETLKAIIKTKPEDKEICMYYLLSHLAGIDISGLSDSSVNRIYTMIEKFRDDGFFKILWLIVFYEYNDVHGLGHKKQDLFVAIESSRDLPLDDREKNLLRGMKVSSKKASSLLR
jgi:hypothetical protein